MRSTNASKLASVQLYLKASTSNPCEDLRAWLWQTGRAPFTGCEPLDCCDGGGVEESVPAAFFDLILRDGPFRCDLHHVLRHQTPDSVADQEPDGRGVVRQPRPVRRRRADDGKVLPDAERHRFEQRVALLVMTTILIAWAIYRDIGPALAIGGIEFFAKFLIYYLHERLWQVVPRGAFRGS